MPRVAARRACCCATTVCTRGGTHVQVTDALFEAPPAGDVTLVDAAAQWVYDDAWPRANVLVDLSGDGIADRATSRDGDGDAYNAVEVQWGPFAGVQDPDLIDAAITGVTFGTTYAQNLGTSGDVDGDGIADLLVSAGGYEPGGIRGAGAGVVVPGGLAGEQVATDVGWAIVGTEEWQNLANCFVPAGDVDADGYADVAISEHGADNGDLEFAGKMSVFYGPLATAQSIDDAEWNLLGTREWETVGYYPYSAAPVGDLTGDGFPDFGVTQFGDVEVNPPVYSSYHVLAGTGR
jgi:hypothetical protein